MQGKTILAWCGSLGIYTYSAVLADLGIPTPPSGGSTFDRHQFHDARLSCHDMSEAGCHERPSNDAGGCGGRCVA